MNELEATVTVGYDYGDSKFLLKLNGSMCAVNILSFTR